MKKYGTLTIGIISRNGMPFIEECLQSISAALPSLCSYFHAITCVLVDSDSSDGTLETMIGFSKKNESVKVHVFRIEGDCNAAIARNIILKRSTGEFVFLCDGDIVINPDFIVVAVAKIIAEKADAIVGQLSEKWYDSAFTVYKSVPVRKEIHHDTYVRMTGGIIVLAGKVVRSGVQFDEVLKRNQDRDFSLRISERFKILAIPVFVGTHLTQPYYSNERFGTFIRERYSRYLGILLRKHLRSLGNLLVIARAEEGVVIGIIYLMSLIASLAGCFFQTCIPLVITCTVVLVDFARYVRKHPPKRFIMHRFLTPLMVIQGFIFPGENRQRYSVKEIV